MRVSIERSEIRGRIKAEPSKSMAHRLLICAGLAGGTSRIDNISCSEDILATIDCLKALGASVKDVSEKDAGTKSLEIKGMDPRTAGSTVLLCRESGSTMRFFIPIAALSGVNMTLKGSDRLLQRPMKVYEDIFNSPGCSFAKTAGSIELKGFPSVHSFEIAADISSQFVSGLLFALPLLDADSMIELIPPIESGSYIDMTLAALDRFGVRAVREGETRILIPGGQSYKACDLTVEGDWSNAAFFLSMGVRVDGLDDNSIQGDRICKAHFERLRRECAEIDISDCPDLGPVLMAYAAMHCGCRLTGTKRLRIKESDRALAMAEELHKFGVDCHIDENSVEVGCGAARPGEILQGHNDHRIVMALSILACTTGGTIDGAEAVNKSFPSFFERIADVGGRFTIEQD